MFLCSLSLNLPEWSQLFDFDFDCDEDPEREAGGRGGRSRLPTLANCIRYRRASPDTNRIIEGSSLAAKALPLVVFEMNLQRKGSLAFADTESGVAHKAVARVVDKADSVRARTGS